MQDDLTGGMLGGEVEVDETFIGGKARNMHQDVKERKGLKNAGPTGKIVVLGILERKGHVRATIIPERTKAVMQEHVRSHVEPGAKVFSDQFAISWKMDEYAHGIVNHAEQYVNGNVHTNGH